MTKYEKIANEIRERIKSEVYKTGELIPDQNSLAEEFQTSRVTVRKAIQILIIEGLLYSKRGAGTFVRSNIKLLSENYAKADDIFGTTRSAGESVDIVSKILKFEVRFPTAEEASDLIIEGSEPIYEILRVRLINGTYKSLEYSIMPVKEVTDLTEAVLEKSIYSYIQKELNKTIGGAHRVISADKASSLDVSELQISETDPVLVVDQVAYLENGIPFEKSTSRYPYQYGKVVADIIVQDPIKTIPF